MKKAVKTILVILLCLAVFFCAGVFAINARVLATAKDRILSFDEACGQAGYDCILVLGCRVHEGGQPSAMLRDRLDQAIALYNAGVSQKLLMSGDHGREDYDEVNAMKDYAIKKGVPSSDVFMDHAGFSTYESLYRAKEVFQAQKILIVTQEYHLYRAVYTAQRLGLEAHGVSADLQTYSGQTLREIREVFARNKDFFWCLVKPAPTYLGEAIPVSGSGDDTNDRV